MASTPGRPRTMSEYYRQGNPTRLGGNARTRGRERQVQRVPQRGDPGYQGGVTR